MKKLKQIEKIFIIILFFIVILFPYLISFFKFNNNLDGSEEKVELTYENLDKYILQNFPGREYLVKTKNQILYSLFNITPNESVTKIGDSLVSTESLYYYLYDLYNVDDNYINSLTNKFVEFNNLCKEKNKNVVIVITPTKLRYYTGKMTLVDSIILAHSKNGNDVNKRIRGYDKLKKRLKECDINFFDCIEYIDSNKETIINTEPPLFYKSGHHWSNYKGNVVGLGFHQYLRDKFNYIIPEITLKASPSNVAVYPDSDLFDILNLYEKPNENFFDSIVSINKLETDKKCFIVQGGSFLGGLLMPYLIVKEPNNGVLISNKNMFIDNYKTMKEIKDWDDANVKGDLLNKCKNADIFIFEINELNVYNATFGFLDYLLEHKGEL